MRNIKVVADIMLIQAILEIKIFFFNFRFDFFLISQHVRQGTVTPTHYVVVHDESGLKADHLQRYIFLTSPLSQIYTPSNDPAELPLKDDQPLTI